MNKLDFSWRLGAVGYIPNSPWRYLRMDDGSEWSKFLGLYWRVMK